MQGHTDRLIVWAPCGQRCLCINVNTCILGRTYFVERSIHLIELLKPELLLLLICINLSILAKREYPTRPFYGNLRFLIRIQYLAQMFHASHFNGRCAYMRQSSVARDQRCRCTVFPRKIAVPRLITALELNRPHPSRHLLFLLSPPCQFEV